MQAESHVESQDPAAALRVIGQELADLYPLILEIEVREDQFVVTGRGLPGPSQDNRAGNNILSKIWKSLIRHDPAIDLVEWQLNSVPFARTYSQADLSRSDHDRFKQRKAPGALPEIYSLGERLRIVGRMVQAKGGELVRLTKTLKSVAFQYRDQDGVVCSEEYSAEELFRIQRQDYSQREPRSESLYNPRNPCGTPPMSVSVEVKSADSQIIDRGKNDQATSNTTCVGPWLS